MPKEFWAEAIDCAVYLLNWYPSKSLDNKTPQRNGMKPIVSHPRIFMSITYLHMPNQRRSKVADRSEKHVFVGYDKQSKGYKLYNSVTRKVVVGRDVEFNEEGSWDWSIEENGRYDFLPMTDEEETCESGEEVQQPKSITPTPNLDSPLSSSEGEPKTRRMQELYERQAMEEEINSIEKNNTWYLTTLLKVQKAIGDKWVYKAKKNAKGELEKYKARLVAKALGWHLEEIHMTWDNLEKKRTRLRLYTMYLEEFVIDDRLSEVVLGKPFMQASKLTYDESLGLIRFAHRDDEVMFRMPQRTKELDLVSPLEKDKFEEFFVESLKVRKKRFKHVLEKRKGYYKACLNLGRTYKRDRETIEKLKTSHVSTINLRSKMTSSLATRLINKEKRFLGGDVRVVGLLQEVLQSPRQCT
ncbi:retrovirus-related pol polyprotein from transposon TNT 1-94 [Tanacetum coccineum]|uniref:Retrovirus-related pol polyprotein from transposon TNT 1-94 n=1 Tax=Tanacetum coccineum TaxID=301880 RepID=A0ABQ5DF67_9ASTR